LHHSEPQHSCDTTDVQPREQLKLSASGLASGNWLEVGTKQFALSTGNFESAATLVEFVSHSSTAGGLECLIALMNRFRAACLPRPHQILTSFLFRVIEERYSATKNG